MEGRLAQALYALLKLLRLGIYNSCQIEVKAVFREILHKIIRESSLALKSWQCARSLNFKHLMLIKWRILVKLRLIIFPPYI
jgi:hypothetical protein